MFAVVAFAVVALIAYALALRLRYFVRCCWCDRGENPGSVANRPRCECRLSECPQLDYFAVRSDPPQHM
jgi:hypothetical protein